MALSEPFGVYDAVSEMARAHYRYELLPREPEPLRFGGSVKLPGYQPDEITKLAREIRRRVRARLAKRPQRRTA